MNRLADLPQADRFGEGRTSNLYWNESAWFSISIPEKKIHGLIQYYFRTNMNMLNGGPVLWEPGARYQWNCLYYDWAHLQALPEGQQKFDVKSRNSLEVHLLEPLKRYAIRYDQNPLQMDLIWEAIGPMHELKTGNAGQQSTAKFHMEQPGRMTGTVKLEGMEYRIDCFSMRDTSFGARDYASLASGGYFWGIAEQSAFHAIAMGEGTDGTPQKVIGGFLWKDGEMSSLVSGTRRITEFGSLGPKRVLFEAIDQLGRTINATGEIEDGLVFTGYTDHSVLWSLLQWDWDGITHWGDNQEFCSAVRFRRIARGEISLN